jgi:hypothetical protein
LHGIAPFVMSYIRQFDSLNTSYVNLAAFIRFLREQEFTGSVHVALDAYEAHLFLNGQGPVVVFEIDPATRQASQNEGSMAQLLLHASKPGGVITVYWNANDSEIGVGQAESPAIELEVDFGAANTPASEDPDWDDLLESGGELIGAVERATQSTGSDFAESFRAVRIELGDDYTFLDPTVGDLRYADHSVTLSERPGADALVAGLTECLRRMVNKLAIDKDGKHLRERVAIELAVAARVRANALGEFTPYLDRIAGTRVL